MLGEFDVSTLLNQLADLLRELRLAGAWRDEQLAVHNILMDEAQLLAAM